MSVAIVMGSDSDLDIVSKFFGVLDDFGVSYTKNVFSAHRTPDKVLELIKSSEENGVEVFIAAAWHGCSSGHWCSCRPHY